MQLLVGIVLKYFKKENPALSDPRGPLSSQVPSSFIAAANKEVSKVLDVEKKSVSASRGKYESFSAVEKATIAKYALEVGVTRGINELQPQFPGRTLKEPTVWSWVTKYKVELKASFKIAGPPLTKIEDKKRGCLCF